MIDARTAPYAALILRVTMGVLFILHGLYLKVFVFSMAGAAGFFETLGLPRWFAWIVMLCETIGGIMLILGIEVRAVAVLLGLHLLAAAWLGHAGNGWVFSNQGGGWEFPVFWAIVCFALALIGDGANAMRPSTWPRSAA